MYLLSDMISKLLAITDIWYFIVIAAIIGVFFSLNIGRRILYFLELKIKSLIHLKRINLILYSQNEYLKDRCKDKDGKRCFHCSMTKELLIKVITDHFPYTVLNIFNIDKHPQDASKIKLLPSIIANGELIYVGIPSEKNLVRLLQREYLKKGSDKKSKLEFLKTPSFFIFGYIALVLGYINFLFSGLGIIFMAAAIYNLALYPEIKKHKNYFEKYTRACKLIESVSHSSKSLFILEEELKYIEGMVKRAYSADIDNFLDEVLNIKFPKTSKIDSILDIIRKRLEFILKSCNSQEMLNKILGEEEMAKFVQREAKSKIKCKNCQSRVSLSNAKYCGICGIQLDTA